MGMISEFKEFALKGNMVDMAVGIVMGGAIGQLVGSLVENMINPLVVLAMGGTDLGALATKIGQRTVEVEKDGAMVSEVQDLMLKYGSFITSFINFLILAFVIFLIVKMVNNAKNKMGIVEPVGGPSEVDLLTEIRDSLKR